MNYKLILVIVFFSLSAFAGCGDGGWGSETGTPCLRPENCITETVAEDDDDSAGDDNDDDDSSSELKKYECGEGSNSPLGIGLPCTKGGNECKEWRLHCDMDLDPLGFGICIKPFCKTNDECGVNAACCKPDESPVSVCLNDECLPSECGGSYDVEVDAGVDDDDATDDDDDSGD